MPAHAQQKNAIRVTDYLLGERHSDIKHEYVAGQVFAMAGAKINHNRITRNVSALLWNELQDQPCEPFSSDMLVKTAKDRYRYPDIVVTCDHDTSDDAYVRETPILIMEVLSHSTRRKDKTEKRAEYIALASLQEYVLIEQDFVEVQIQRRSTQWQAEYFYLGEAITLESINMTLNVADIYQRVDNADMNSYLASLVNEVEANKQQE